VSVAGGFTRRLTSPVRRALERHWVALAAHLRSVVVLDDQLTHSDPCRTAWFRNRLRAGVRDHDHQIIVITCRPLDYVRPEEMLAHPCGGFESEDGRLALVDLERGISME
jgi:hypothetical protein